MLTYQANLQSHNVATSHTAACAMLHYQLINTLKHHTTMLATILGPISVASPQSGQGW